MCEEGECLAPSRSFPNSVLFHSHQDQTRQNNMADEKSVDQKFYFPVGSHIKCVYQGNHVEGEIAAYHNVSRLLIIRAQASNGKASANDVYVINTEILDKIAITNDHVPAEIVRPIDFQKLEKRRLKAIGLKKARIRALSADVAPEGRKLFLTITKTIDEVVWDGDVIVVLNEVRISPPYKVENVNGEKEASVIHVRKIVDKHWKETSVPVVSA